MDASTTERFPLKSTCLGISMILGAWLSVFMSEFFGLMGEMQWHYGDAGILIIIKARRIRHKAHVTSAEYS